MVDFLSALKRDKRGAETAPMVRSISVEQRSKAFAAAHRHSRHVKFLKFALPLTAGALIAFVYVLVTVDSVIPEGLEISSIEVESGKLVMVDPVMNGFTKDQKPYKVTAKRALQDTKKPSIVELEQLSATMPFSDDSEALMTATGGVMDNDTNIMQFADGIKIVTNDGMTATLQSATIQINDGTMQTSDPVEIEREGFFVRADRLDVMDNGENLLFQDRVKVVIDPKTVRREP